MAVRAVPCKCSRPNSRPRVLRSTKAPSISGPGCQRVAALPRPKSRYTLRCRLAPPKSASHQRHWTYRSVGSDNDADDDGGGVSSGLYFAPRSMMRALCSASVDMVPSHRSRRHSNRLSSVAGEYHTARTHKQVRKHWSAWFPLPRSSTSDKGWSIAARSYASMAAESEVCS